MMRRNRRKPTASFDERLQKAADDARQAAEKLPQGPERDMLLNKASQAETAVRINRWLSSPGLQSPR
nr:hypothetical protein [Bradyrhizobium sp. ARR65]